MADFNHNSLKLLLAAEDQTEWNREVPKWTPPEMAVKKKKHIEYYPIVISSDVFTLKLK